MVYIIIGGPATGKGTISDILSSNLNIPHISTGELSREYAKENEDIRKMLAKGILVPDNTMAEILEDRLKKDDCKNGFILDGYPRTYIQVELLEELLLKFNKKITKVIELTVPDEVAIKRTLGRKKCINCGKVYGVDFPPKIDKACDICGGRLDVRSDDTEETLKRRIKTYRENSKDILEYYKNKNLLKTIDASTDVSAILQKVKESEKL